MTLRRAILPILASLLLTSTSSAHVMRLTDMLSPPFKPFDANPSNFDILTHLLQASNLTATLSSMRGYTLFAPNDRAFIRAAAYFAGCSGPVTEPVAFRALLRAARRPAPIPGRGDGLREMLLNHVVRAPITSRMLLGRPSLLSTDAKGGRATIINAGTGELVDASPRTPNAVALPAAFDVFLADGVVVHVVDAVLLPVAANVPVRRVPCM